MCLAFWGLNYLWLAQSVCSTNLNATLYNRKFKYCSLQDSLEDQIKTEKSQLTELESQIRKVEREVLNLKKKDVPELQLCEKAIECARNMDLLENRLYVVCLHSL